MIKLPKEVNQIMKSLESRGFQVYAVGACVRDSLMGFSPADWDLATNARLADLKQAFPGAQLVSEKYSIIRMDFTAGEEDPDGLIVDIATYRKAGSPADSRQPGEVAFADTIQEDLKHRDFTVNAIADNPSASIVDPYGGRADIKAKLLRTVGDPDEQFVKDPIQMLRGVRLVAEYGFKLDPTVVEAVKRQAPLLSKAAAGLIRDEFSSLVSGEHAGKALRMLTGYNLMEAIVGPEAMTLNRSQIRDFDILCENIHLTKAVTLRRLGLFYICFGKKKGLLAIGKLPYDPTTRQHLTDAVSLLDDIYFVRTFDTFKKFLAKYGMERYDYLHNLSKAQRIVYDLTEARIVSRNEVLKELLVSGQPIYIEDLAVNEDDLRPLGIPEGDKMREMLLMLTDVVHRRPHENTKKILLEYVRKFSKSKWAAKTRNVKWIK